MPLIKPSHKSKTLQHQIKQLNASIIAQECKALQLSGLMMNQCRQDYQRYWPIFLGISMLMGMIASKITRLPIKRTFIAKIIQHFFFF